MINPRLSLLLAATVATMAAPLAVTSTVASGKTAPPADASIRAAHYSPTTPGVDVYLSRFAGGRAPSKLWLSKITYGSVTGYQPLRPGLYSVAMRKAGAPASSTPLLTWTLNARARAAYTVAGVGADSDLRGVVVKDDLSSPPAGKGRVRVVQAASRAPVASLTADSGTVIADDVRFASVTGYTTLPSGKWRVSATVTDAGRTGSVARSGSTSSPVTIRSGQTTSILLLDGKAGGITLRSTLDSSSAGSIPRSSVDAGAGGTAPEVMRSRTDGGATLGWISTGLVVAVAAMLFLRRRAHRTG